MTSSVPGLHSIKWIDDWWRMNCKGLGRKRLWYNRCTTPEICQGRLSKTTKHWVRISGGSRRNSIRRYDLKACGQSILMQLLAFWTLPMVLILNKKTGWRIMSEHPITECSHQVLSTDRITSGSNCIPQPIDGVASLRRASGFTRNGYYHRHIRKSDTEVRKRNPDLYSYLSMDVPMPPRT
jgi:hypothetical protein